MEGITSLFQWVIMSSIMASVLTCLILFTKLIFKNRLGANWHYCIWFLLIIRLMIPYAPKSSMSIFNVVTKAPVSNVSYHSNYFINESIRYNRAEKDKVEITNKSLSKQNENKNIYSNINECTSIQYEKIKSKIMFLWITGALILGTYTIIQNVKLLLDIKGETECRNGSICNIFNECKDVINIDKDISIIFTTKVATPSLFGIVKPRLLFPENLLEELSNKELKHIFLHELVHFKRKDILVNWVTVLLQILHWFNPIVWLGFYKMHNDCEIACDSMVLSFIKEEERKEYGYTIIHLLNIISEPGLVPGSTGILSNKHHIKRRITMISLFKKGSFWGKAIAVVFFISIGFLGLTNAKGIENIKASQQININENKNNKKVEGQIEGKGVIVTLSDKSNIEEEITKDNPYESLVFITDIANVINELNSAGAKAISLNDERVTDVNKMEVSGMFIKVNDKKVGNPFVIKAIGDATALENSLKSDKSILNDIKIREVRVKWDKGEKILIPEKNKY
ncbi:M56 family metallopeptidase [Clostridium lundense]|uniref:M56 family metallopeptidase n=1 Tax=Clostridium lundense TaxID=319475 RepID=UPI000483862D|nr:M56 family metallopeptidase [Clostridium lundense]